MKTVKFAYSCPKHENTDHSDNSIECEEESVRQRFVDRALVQVVVEPHRSGNNGTEDCVDWSRHGMSDDQE
jgi:hypothetical protein